MKLPTSSLPDYLPSVLNCHVGHINKTICSSLTQTSPNTDYHSQLPANPPSTSIKVMKTSSDSSEDRDNMKGNAAGFCWSNVEVRMRNVLCLCKLTGKCFPTKVPGKEDIFTSLYFWLNIFKSAML